MPTERGTKTRHQHGPGEGSGDGPAGAIAVLVWDSAGLAQWRDDTTAHREIQNLGHGITAGELSQLGHLHQIQRSNKGNLAEDYFLTSFPLSTNIRML